MTFEKNINELKKISDSNRQISIVTNHKSHSLIWLRFCNKSKLRGRQIKYHLPNNCGEKLPHKIIEKRNLNISGN